MEEPDESQNEHRGLLENEVEGKGGKRRVKKENIENREFSIINADEDHQEMEEEEEDEETLEDHASVVITIMQPVAITMLIVIYVVRTIKLPAYYIGPTYMTLAYQEQGTDSIGQKLIGGIENALIFLGFIILTTIVLVLLYKYRCLKIIYGWLMFTTAILLAFFGGFMFYSMIVTYNLPLDFVTFSFIVWNFMIVGILAIFWYGPSKLNQGYLIIISSLMATVFTYLPEWTTWCILAVVAIYDLFAVLCPRGPLRILVETAQKRDEPIPALLYNASVVMTMADPENPQIQEMKEEHEQDPELELEPENPPRNDNKRRGIKLGLGDFVFYSVLVGRAALYDMITVFTSFVGIITGLFFTLVLLAMFKKALPALPISIAFGFIFYFTTRLFLMDFVTTVGLALAFV